MFAVEGKMPFAEITKMSGLFAASLIFGVILTIMVVTKVLSIIWSNAIWHGSSTDRLVLEIMTENK